MKKEWLSDIIKNGTLVDNQSFKVVDSVFQKTFYNEAIELKQRAKGEQKYKFRMNDQVWWFINETSLSINSQFLTNLKKNVVHFNQNEYEHNTDDNFINTSGYNEYNFLLQTGNVIGYVKKGHYSLKISSRFGDQFLKYIIADADGFIELENQGGSKEDNSYEWLLYYLWAIKLKAAYRLGVPKNYVPKQERLTKVRGNIDPVDYFLNGNTGKYICKYREHSFNTPTARIIEATFDKIGQHAFLSGMRPIKNAFIVATEGQKTKIPELLKTQNVANPYYQDYNPVIELSKKILQNEKMSFGDSADSSAFLFDVSMLFEYFIKKLLARNGFQMLSKFNKSLTIETGTYQRKLQPDLLFEDESGFHVFDVKYKAFDNRYGVNREDLFQLHTYIGQYGNINSINGCGFIYPSNDKENKIIKKTIIMFGVSVPFYICLLAIPKEDEGFNKLFKEKCDDFIVSLKSYLKN